ncbi:MAG: hypothetical protein M1537_02115 [Nitrospirae bacterium]|nr:hypothetical protein [Nitrospirota bacterium]MCL5284265.1 hypothetical protein [Nitrospirota bacterium]
MIDQSFTILAKPNTGDYYEGSRNYLRAIYPRPYVSPASLVVSPVQIDIVFREDSYDPTTRTRRGRFYQATNQFQIPSGLVPYQPYPRPQEITGERGGKVFQFQTAFEQNDKLNSDLSRSKDDYGVLIGAPPAETRWRVIDVEALSDGTVLFTLKSLSSFGLLPILKIDDLEIKAAYEKVVDAALKYAPVPVVDVCRESTRVILSKDLKIPGDLGPLIKKIPKIDNNIPMTSLSAQIINRLHSRGKSSEKERRLKAGTPIRAVVDDDAVLAVRLFGFLLTELGLADP